MSLSKENYHKILFLLLGILIPITLKFLGIKTLVLFVFGVAGIIITFYSIELSVSIFIVLMSIIPHEFWNNLLFLYAIVFYFSVYFIQVITKKRKGITIKDINLPLLFLFLFGIYGVIISADVKDALRIFVLQASAMGFSILLLAILKDKKSLNLFIDFLCISIFLTAFYGIMQKFIWGIEKRSEFIDTIVSSDMPGRLFSTMDNANNYAEYLVLFLPICIAHFLNVKNEFKKVIIFCITGVGIYVLYATLSRGSYIAFAFGLLFFMLMINKRLVFFGLIALIAILPIGISLLNTFLPVFINRLSTVGKDSSSKFRLIIWDGAFETLKNYWISGIGIGPNTFKNVFANFADPLATRAMHSHNLFLQQFLDLGIFGFISFLALIYSNLKNNIKSFLKTNDTYYKNLLASYIFAIVAILSFGLVEYVWYYPRVMFCFWIVIGLSFATIKQSQKPYI